jgi:transcriptional regulator with XRE-family HTH domain
MGCPDKPQTIGEHLKKRRIELGLKQTEVASLLGVHRGSVQLWEQGRGEQGVRSFPAIIRFLGYVPFECDATPGGHFAFLRRCSGKTQEELAELTDCDPSSIARWESGMTKGAKKLDATTAEVWAELKKSGITETVKRSLSILR